MIRSKKWGFFVLAFALTLLLLVSCSKDEPSTPTHVHNEETRIENISEATCLADGSYEEVIYCLDCNEIISRQTKSVPRLEHKYLLCECIYCADTLLSVGLEFTQNTDGSYTVTGIGDCEDSAIYVPSEYCGERVVAIGDRAFYSSRITEVHLPVGILRIGEEAFASCKRLHTVEVGDELLFVGKGAFDASSSIKKTEFAGGLYLGYESNPYVILLDAKKTASGISEFANGVRCICSSALEGADMQEIIIPDGVSSIGDRAFANMKKLGKVYISESVTYIGSEVFAGSSAITEIDVADTSFMFKSVDGNLYSADGKTLIQCAVAALSGELVLPLGLEKIESYALFGAKNLISVIIPDGVTEIGSLAFSGCSMLENLSIPDSIRAVGEGAVASCPRLVYTERDKVVFLGNTENPYAVLVKTLDESITSYAIPDTTRVILSKAFYNCSVLVGISIPNSVRYIGKAAFQYCPSAEWVTIGSAVEYIGEYAFFGCTGFRNLTVPNSVTYIGASAFRGCIRLRNVTLSASLTELSESVFSYCEAIRTINIPSGVKVIGDNAFYFCTRLSSVVFPTTIEKIGFEAFRECYSLENVMIGGVIKEIGNGAFRNCSGLKSVMLGEGLLKISSLAFSECISLGILSIPESVQSIGADAFENCPVFATSEYGGCTYLGFSTNPYMYLVGVQESVSVTLREDVYSVILGAFDGADLTYNEYEGGLYLGSEENPYFMLVGIKDKNATESKIHESTKMIAPGAYDGCNLLERVTIGAGVEYIGRNAFSSLEALVGVELSGVTGWTAYDSYTDSEVIFFADELCDSDALSELLSDAYSDYEWRRDA